jgi:amino acid transporter
MWLRIFYFFSLLFTALALAPALAHLFVLPNKIHLSRNDYLIVQQIYRRWEWLGVFLVLALIANLLLTIATRHQANIFIFNILACICIAVSLVVFFSFTFPANEQTYNWTMLPDNWQKLRRQWEYSHAVNAGIYFIAFMSLIISVLKMQRK